ncbi:MAG: DUF4255 domain-containing protein [Bacteroidetes bacterium]|nr:DUF4255 domain-containing protein [Bacteroidota bacterium]
MLDLTLKFLNEELNQFLVLQPGLVMGDMSLVMAAVSRIFDSDSNNVDVPLANKAIMSLVHVEEDRIGRQQEAFSKNASGVTYAQPPVKLNLYVLFVMNLKSHEQALRWLSCIIRFFQFQPVFTPLSHPALNAAITQLNVEMVSLSFEQSNQLWSTLGGKYLPSVLYKIRQVTVDEGAIIAGGGYIKTVMLKDRSKQAIS